MTMVKAAAVAELPGGARTSTKSRFLRAPQDRLFAALRMTILKAKSRSFPFATLIVRMTLPRARA
jgi:hypothetical protein